MGNLKISGNTNQTTEWNIDDVLVNTIPNKSIKDMVNIINQYDWDNTIARNGMTYLEIEQFNNSYNNF